MAEFNTRIKQKRDTSANWTAKDPVLLDGEIIIVDTASGSVRKKVGDGTKKYSQLPFDDEEILTALGEKANNSIAINTTLLASAWAGADAPYTQTITVSGLTALQNGTISVAHNATAEQREMARAAMLSVIGQADGTLTIAADGEMPEHDIPVYIILLG